MNKISKFFASIPEPRSLLQIYLNDSEFNSLMRKQRNTSKIRKIPFLVYGNMPWMFEVRYFATTVYRKVCMFYKNGWRNIIQNRTFFEYLHFVQLYKMTFHHQIEIKTRISRWKPELWSFLDIIFYPIVCAWQSIRFPNIVDHLRPTIYNLLLVLRTINQATSEYVMGFNDIRYARGRLL